MPLYRRQDIPKILSEIAQGVTPQVYLFFGERYLCQSSAQEIIEQLLPEKNRQVTSLLHIDGDQEDFHKTLTQLKTFNLFSGPRIFLVTDSKLFYSKGVTKNVWEKVCEKKERNETKEAQRYLLQMLNLAGISPAEMIDENMSSLSAPRWKSLFGFTRPETDLAWIHDLLADIPAGATPPKMPETDAAALFNQAFESGIPPANILILLAEAVDKRKRFYKYIQEHGIIFDLTVESGGSAAAKRDQESVLKDLIRSTLKKYDKKIDHDTIPILLDRVGFHPIAAVMETEKLALYIGDREVVTKEDVDSIIGRTREEALYELTETVTSAKLEEGLNILAHLQDKGVHGLAILATLRNHLKKLLLVRSLQELKSPAYTKSISFKKFQNDYLPKLKEGREEWSTLLWKSHPYGLYMLFRQAAQFSCAVLQEDLKEVLAAEYRLKGSPVDSRLIMDSLLFNLIRQKMAGIHAS